MTIAYEFEWDFQERPRRVFQHLYIGRESSKAFFWGTHPAMWCTFDEDETSMIRKLLPWARPDPLPVFWELLRPT